jgi:hypothetical protein
MARCGARLQASRARRTIGFLSGNRAMMKFQSIAAARTARVFLPAAALLLASASALAGPPVPVYPLDVIHIDNQGSGSLAVKTRDSVATVVAWYRAHLTDKTGEHTDSSGTIFYTKTGAMVAIQPGNRFDPGTVIGYVWDGTKYGPFTGK